MKEKLKWINMLSLSVGWGRSGRPSGGSTSMYSTYSSDGSYLGVTAIAPQQIRLKVIRPANNDTWNFGSHFAFFRNKISGDVQGVVRNNGWEFNLAINNFIRRGKFSASFNMAFSNNRNEILEMDEYMLNKYGYVNYHLNDNGYVNLDEPGFDDAGNWVGY